MLDFQNAKFIKLRPVEGQKFIELISPMLASNEQVIAAFQGIRDGVVFTDRRIISINIQGLTGRKKDFSSLPYSKVQVFSVETAGHFDLESELILWFSGLGTVRFEFSGRADISEICRMISEHSL